jgi:hypothetical protein
MRKDDADPRNRPAARTHTTLGTDLIGSLCQPPAEFERDTRHA